MQSRVLSYYVALLLCFVALLLLPKSHGHVNAGAKKPGNVETANAVAVLRLDSVRGARLQARSEPQPPPSQPPEDPERIAALRRAASRFRTTYGGADKKELRETLRAGGGTDEERAAFAALEREAQEYRRYTRALKHPPPPATSLEQELAAAARTLDAMDAELMRLRSRASEYRSTYLGSDKRALREALQRADLAAPDADAHGRRQRPGPRMGGQGRDTSDTGSGQGAGEIVVTPEQLQHFRETRAASNAYQNLHLKRARRALKVLKLQRDRYERDFLAGTPESEAARAQLEAGHGTAQELAHFRSLRRAYEDYETKFGLQSDPADAKLDDDLGSPPQEQPQRAGATTTTTEVASGAKDAARPPQRQYSAVEREALRRQANAYQRAYVRKPEFKRLLDSGGGTAAQQEAYATAKAAYNAYRALVARTQSRVPRVRLTYPRDAAAEVRELEELRADYNLYTSLRRSATQKSEFLAGDPTGAKRAEFERLRTAALRYRQLYRRASVKTRDIVEGVGGTAGTPRRRRTRSQSWMQQLSPDELKRIEAVAHGHGEWYRLGLNNEAGRAAFVADDPTHEKRAQLESYHSDFLEYTRIYKKAKRAQARLAAAEGAELTVADNEAEPLGVGEGEVVEDWSLEGRRRYFLPNTRPGSTQLDDPQAIETAGQALGDANPGDVGGESREGPADSRGDDGSSRLFGGAGFSIQHAAPVVRNLQAYTAESLKSLLSHTKTTISNARNAARHALEWPLNIPFVMPAAGVSNPLRLVHPRR